MISELDQRILSMRPVARRCVAVASAAQASVLKSVSRAYKMGFIDAILFGPSGEIKSVAAQNNIDISGFEIVDCADDIESAARAVSCVRDGRANILMKGLVHTADILRAVLNRETGIRGDGILSHISVLYSPSRNRTLFLTDIAMVMYPDLAQKVQLINNAVSFARHMGVDTPRVAPLCAVETLNPKMQATVDAATLRDMNARGEIKNCIVDGPLAFDIAVSPAAAATKGYDGIIRGDADILLFDNIEAGNNTIKAMVQFSDWLFGGVVLGARVPIILNSRSDSDLSKLYSIACACTMDNK